MDANSFQMHIWIFTVCPQFRFHQQWYAPVGCLYAQMSLAGLEYKCLMQDGWILISQVSSTIVKGAVDKKAKQEFCYNLKWDGPYRSPRHLWMIADLYDYSYTSATKLHLPAASLEIYYVHVLDNVYCCYILEQWYFRTKYIICTSISRFLMAERKEYR